MIAGHIGAIKEWEIVVFRFHIISVCKLWLRNNFSYEDDVTLARQRASQSISEGKGDF